MFVRESFPAAVCAPPLFLQAELTNLWMSININPRGFSDWEMAMIASSFPLSQSSASSSLGPGGVLGGGARGVGVGTQGRGLSVGSSSLGGAPSGPSILVRLGHINCSVIVTSRGSIFILGCVSPARAAWELYRVAYKIKFRIFTRPVTQLELHHTNNFVKVREAPERPLSSPAAPSSCYSVTHPDGRPPTPHLPASSPCPPSAAITPSSCPTLTTASTAVLRSVRARYVVHPGITFAPAQLATRQLVCRPCMSHDIVSLVLLRQHPIIKKIAVSLSDKNVEFLLFKIPKEVFAKDEIEPPPPRHKEASEGQLAKSGKHQKPYTRGPQDEASNRPDVFSGARSRRKESTRGREMDENDPSDNEDESEIAKWKRRRLSGPGSHGTENEKEVSDDDAAKMASFIDEEFDTFPVAGGEGVPTAVVYSTGRVMLFGCTYTRQIELTVDWLLPILFNQKIEISSSADSFQ
eukprot:GHVT01072464.1.p1 GENE.GHVT01072464.1~~GHVT01072464.1.p1  ORF type:complete len:465 (-),score=84.12 GHVT01072464.1:1017-2411(-)